MGCEFVDLEKGYLIVKFYCQTYYANGEYSGKSNQSGPYIHRTFSGVELNLNQPLVSTVHSMGRTYAFLW